jgi:hypothetical protein
LVEWSHIWETGEDNKASPFFRRKGLLEWNEFYHQAGDKDVTRLPFYQENICPVTALNEQAFHLWSLDAMAEMAVLQQEEPTPYRQKAERILATVFGRHWDEETGFYYDYDVKANALSHAKNLDALYIMYFERDPVRLERLLAHLIRTDEFNLELLPSLSRDEDQFDPQSYWAGAAWPREQGFVALALARQGRLQDAYEWIVRVVCCEQGPTFSETVNPLSWPLRSHGTVTAMVMSSVNQLVLLDVCGLSSWTGPVRVERGMPQVDIVRGHEG